MHRFQRDRFVVRDAAGFDAEFAGDRRDVTSGTGSEAGGSSAYAYVAPTPRFEPEVGIKRSGAVDMCAGEAEFCPDPVDVFGLDAPVIGLGAPQTLKHLHASASEAALEFGDDPSWH
jgi:hypothetical protein